MEKSNGITTKDVCSIQDLQGRIISYENEDKCIAELEEYLKDKKKDLSKIHQAYLNDVLQKMLFLKKGGYSFAAKFMPGRCPVCLNEFEEYIGTVLAQGCAVRRYRSHGTVICEMYALHEEGYNEEEDRCPKCGKTLIEKDCLSFLKTATTRPIYDELVMECICDPQYGGCGHRFEKRYTLKYGYAFVEKEDVKKAELKKLEDLLEGFDHTKHVVEIEMGPVPLILISVRKSENGFVLHFEDRDFTYEVEDGDLGIEEMREITRQIEKRED